MTCAVLLCGKRKEPARPLFTSSCAAILSSSRVAAILLLLTAPAFAGDTAPGAMLTLVPQEWQRSVIMGELPSCTDLGDCCGVHRPCGDWYQRPDDPVHPAPVPLPFSGLMLAAALGLLWRMRHG